MTKEEVLERIEDAEKNNLTHLDLNYNKLSRLPSEIFKIQNIEYIDLDENPLEFPPPEIVNQGVYAIKEYLLAAMEEEEKSVYEAKLIVVGQGGVGKTCLCNRLLYSATCPDCGNEVKVGEECTCGRLLKEEDICTGNEKTTEGIDVRNWEMVSRMNFTN